MFTCAWRWPFSFTALNTTLVLLSILWPLQIKDQDGPAQGHAAAMPSEAFYTQSFDKAHCSVHPLWAVTVSQIHGRASSRDQEEDLSQDLSSV